METPQVGTDVDGWCTRCKLILAHTIEATVGTKITRVHCNTCGSQHAYRSRPPGQRPQADGAPRGSRRAPRTTESATVQGYEALMRGRNAATARPYAAAERFVPAELISHPAFGVGLVTKVKEGNKIEVAFKDGPKVLVHAR
jgi:hypothetical protein